MSSSELSKAESNVESQADSDWVERKMRYAGQDAHRELNASRNM